MQCLGQNYAYYEASYFLVRLLQQFDTFTLASDAQPKESLPLREWKIPGTKGRSAVEQVWPSAALTLYVKVSVYKEYYPVALIQGIPGWTLGPIWEIKVFLIHKLFHLSRKSGAMYDVTNFPESTDYQHYLDRRGLQSRVR